MDDGSRTLRTCKMTIDGEMHSVQPARVTFDETYDLMGLECRGIICRAGNYVDRVILVDKYNQVTNADQAVSLSIGSHIKPLVLNNKLKLMLLQFNISEISVEHKTAKLDFLINFDDSQLINSAEEISNMITNSYTKLFDLFVGELVETNKRQHTDGKLVLTTEELQEAGVMMFARACSATQQYLKMAVAELDQEPAPQPEKKDVDPVINLAYGAQSK